MAQNQVLKAMKKKKGVAVGESSTDKNAQMHVTITTHVLGETPETHQFVLSNGKKINSLFQLADELEQMGDDVFGHHVSAERNDFATWVNDVFNEKFLAEDMRKVWNRLETQRVLLKGLAKELLKKARL